MAKAAIADYSTTAASNTDIDGLDSAGATGLVKSGDNYVRSLMAHAKANANDLGAVNTVGGTGDAITVTLAASPTALVDGYRFVFSASAINTGATTIAVTNGAAASLGTKKIRKWVAGVETALAAGDIAGAGSLVEVIYDTAADSAAGAFMLVVTPSSVSSTQPQGQHTIWVPAGAMQAATTSGAASGSGETATNKVMRKTFDFDTTSEEFVQFAIQMPKSWDESTLIVQYVWSHPAAVTNFGVAWGIEAVAFADDDTLDAAWGTEVAVTDTGGTTDDIYITAESTAVTVAGSPAAEELVAFRITRVVGNAGDTLAVDARLHGVKVHYTTNANTDS